MRPREPDARISAHSRRRGKLGPLQFMIIGFDGNRFTGEILPELNELRSRKLIRLLDLVFIRRDGQDEITSLELSDLPEEDMQHFALEDGEGAAWFAQDDLEQIGATLPEHSSVAMLLVEHLWAEPLQAATRKANGRVIAEGMVPREVVAEVEALLDGKNPEP